MIGIEIDEGQVKRLVDATHKARKGFKKELAGAINQVSKKTRLDMGRAVREVVALKKKESERDMSVRLSTETQLAAVVSLKKYKGSKSGRLGLRHFGAKQDKRGVSYRISKQGGRKRINGAFTGPRPGVVKMSWKGNVFIRTGKSRLPIVQKMGVSPLGVYLKNELAGPQAAAVSEELKKQIERRINLNVLRASGLVKT